MRIYSFALTPSQIAAEMRGEAVEAPATVAAPSRPRCGALSDNEDKVLPFAAALLGALVSIACVGLRPSGSPLLAPSASLAAGALLLAFTAPNLPSFASWLLPVVALAGGASVAVSVRRTRD